MARPCVFCSILRGDIPGHFVFRPDAGEGPDGGVGPFGAFLDQRPLFKGHVLLVPEAHHETLTELPNELVGPFFLHAQRLARAMELVLGAAGSFVAINNRISQSVPHLHLHVVPRNPKDGLKGFFWPRTTYEDDGEMAGYAARLREGLAGR